MYIYILCYSRLMPKSLATRLRDVFARSGLDAARVVTYNTILENVALIVSYNLNVDIHPEQTGSRRARNSLRRNAIRIRAAHDQTGCSHVCARNLRLESGCSPFLLHKFKFRPVRSGGNSFSRPREIIGRQ